MLYGIDTASDTFLQRVKINKNADESAPETMRGIPFTSELVI